MTSPLCSTDYAWIAEAVMRIRQDIATSPRWRRRLEMSIDNLLWAASVDGVDDDGTVGQDSWVASGGGLKAHHFDRVPATDAARNAFAARDLKSIKREHVVPRAVLRKIVLKTGTAHDTQRVLEAYARVALVHDHEARKLPTSTMPRGWPGATTWSPLPAPLPDAWARYRAEGIVPTHPDGTPAY